MPDYIRAVSMKFKPLRHILFLCILVILTGCSEYSYLYKSNDFRYKYEIAKTYYALGKTTKAITLLEDILMQMKGTPYADESLYMLGDCYMRKKDYELAATYFRQYYTSYPYGKLAETARYQTARALYLGSPEFRLDQTASYHAIQEAQIYLEYYPEGTYKGEVENIMYTLQDKLAEKELASAKLYYNIGALRGQNNYLSCVITAQNALRDYPYTRLREEFSIYVLRAKYQLAERSIIERRAERYREAVDEYYAFKNEYPESKYIKEVEKIGQSAQSKIQDTTEI